MSNTKIPTEELDIFLRLNDLKVVFDVGARDDLDMFELKPELEYHLFEPVPEFCETLRLKANGAKNIFINQFGLADRVGEYEYNEYRQSFLYVTETDKRYVTNTLDWYTEVMNVQPDFIKIDTEGLDLNVIIGGQKTIQKTRFVQFEYWNGFYDFLPYLKGFEFYLMIEPELRKEIKKVAQNKEFDGSLIKINNEIVRLIYQYLIPAGAGGNILCVHS